SPRLEAEDHRLRAASESVREADAADDPKVGLDASAAAQGPPITLQIPNAGSVTVRPPMQGSVSVQAALPIDLSGQLRYIRRAARYSERGQRERYRQAMQQLLLEVIDGYYRVLAASSGVDAAGARVTEAGEALRVAESLRSAGAATDTEVALAEAELASSREALAQARGGVADARAALAALIGLRADQCPELRPDALTLDTGLEFEAARALALDQRPELRALAWTARSLGASAEAIHRSTRPSLSLGALAEATTPSTAFAPAGSWRVGLTFSWPISDGGAADAQEAQRRETRQAVLRDLEDVRLMTEVQVHAAGTRLTVLADEIAASRAALDSAQAALDRVMARADAGAARPLEVLRARSARAGAEAALDRDVYERSAALAEWARAVGVIDRLIVPDMAMEPEPLEEDPQ
ncbi:MAG: hypothetical protein GF320_12585, partial [Armatimonadia bacterium]|nr:hypothetical protein [Armatimonadia bacterium]